jgi:hypothetical protein
MEKDKKYLFNFMDSEYEAIKNEKEELILSEVG